MNGCEMKRCTSYVNGVCEYVGKICKYNETENANYDSCDWIYEEDTDLYETDCGLTWRCTEDTPKENEMEYCPKCGNKINEVKPETD